MSKNSSFNLYAITVSLPPENCGTPQKYVELHNKLRKGTKCSMYVLEYGKNGDHLHYHSFLHFEKNKRRDHLKTKLATTVKRIFKLEEIKKPMLHISLAYNPVYFIENYLTKESQPVCFDMDIKPYLQRELYYAVNALGRTLIPLHQGNFELAIRTLENPPICFTEKFTGSIAMRFTAIESELDKLGYQTKIFRSQTSFVHKTLLKIFEPSQYQASVQRSVDKLTEIH